MGKALIREKISLAEAPSFGKTILEYRPDSHGAEDYLALCKEITERS
jgi:chromosome partitioning protein